MILGLELKTRVVANWHSAKGNYHSMTSVKQWRDKLYPGSNVMSCVAVLPLP